MRDILPDITIKIDISPSQFIERMEEITDAEDWIEKVLKEEDFLGEGFDILGIVPEERCEHTGISGQLISDPDLEDRVKVEIRAVRWEPDPPTYEVYVAEAKRIIGSLLKKYNTKYGTNLRMKIQSKHETEPKLPLMANELFNRFVMLANKSSLHPRDWRRFYQFTRFCHAKRIKASEEDINRLLIQAGFNSDYALYISDIYQHCRDLLRIKYYPPKRTLKP